MNTHIIEAFKHKDAQHHLIEGVDYVLESQVILYTRLKTDESHNTQIITTLRYLPKPCFVWMDFYYQHDNIIQNDSVCICYQNYNHNAADMANYLSVLHVALALAAQKGLSIQSHMQIPCVAYEPFTLQLPKINILPSKEELPGPFEIADNCCHGTMTKIIFTDKKGQWRIVTYHKNLKNASAFVGLYHINNDVITKARCYSEMSLFAPKKMKEALHNMSCDGEPQEFSDIGPVLDAWQDMQDHEMPMGRLLRRTLMSLKGTTSETQKQFLKELRNELE